MNEERAIVRSDQGLIVRPETPSAAWGWRFPAEAERLKRRGAIVGLGEWMLTLPQLECPLKHYFSKGMYVREIFMPKGALVIGKIHRTEHPNVVSKGRLLVASERDVRMVEAPYLYISQPGIQKVLLILEDTVWSTFHANPSDERDIDKLEAELAAPDYDDPALIEVLTSRAIEAAKEIGP